MGRLILFALGLISVTRSTQIYAQRPCNGDNDYLIQDFGGDASQTPCICDTLTYLYLEDTVPIQECIKGHVVKQFEVDYSYPLDSLPPIMEYVHTTGTLVIRTKLKINKALIAQNTVKDHFYYLDVESTTIDPKLGLFRNVKWMEIGYTKAKYIDFSMFSLCDSLNELNIHFSKSTLKADRAFILPKNLKTLSIGGAIDMSEDVISSFAKSNLVSLHLLLNPRKNVPINIAELASIKNLSIGISSSKKISKRREQKIYKKLKASLPNLR